MTAAHEMDLPTLFVALLIAAGAVLLLDATRLKPRSTSIRACLV
jgi:hypothetical protein